LQPSTVANIWPKTLLQCGFLWYYWRLDSRRFYARFMPRKNQEIIPKSTQIFAIVSSPLNARKDVGVVMFYV
jgi:hypothetical protein